MKSVSLHKCFLAFSFFLLGFAREALAQMPTINTSVDKRKVLIGEQFRYRVEAALPSDEYQVKWFTVPDSLGSFVVVSPGTTDTLQKDGMIHYGQTLTLTSFDSGERVIPPLAIHMDGIRGDSSFDMVSDSVEMVVAWTPLDSVKPFHDIKGILPVSKASKWWWLWVLGGLVILATLYLLLRKKFRKKSKLFTEPELPDYEEAMLAFRKLSEEKLLEKQKFKEFHLGLSDIFKRYLSRKTGVSMMNLMTEELLLELQKYPISREVLSELGGCLKMGNAVKFAKYTPPLYENEKCLDKTKEMIEKLHALEGKSADHDL